MLHDTRGKFRVVLWDAHDRLSEVARATEEFFAEDRLSKFDYAIVDGRSRLLLEGIEHMDDAEDEISGRVDKLAEALRVQEKSYELLPWPWEG